MICWSWCSISWIIHELYNDLQSLLEIVKTEKVEKLVGNLHDKNEYVTDIRNFKPALYNGIVLK